uniref:hypothetical protein n=1 Tax=Acetomicrobium sp. S15 = DSM 107314 TaxID=2529858 RepID=UPI001E4DA04C
QRSTSVGVRDPLAQTMSHLSFEIAHAARRFESRTGSNEIRADQPEHRRDGALVSCGATADDIAALFDEGDCELDRRLRLALARSLRMLTWL